MLVCENVNSYYGPAHTLFDISLRVNAGTATCLLGRNGAGKTTTLRSIMGLVNPSSGRILLSDTDIVGLPAFEIARRGVGYVPEGLRVFSELSVEDNLTVARRPARNGSDWTADRIYSVFPILGTYRRRLAGTLSGGQRQMLNISRALVGNPRLLLIDEPTEGLAPLVVHDLTELFLRIKREGLTLLLAAQNVNFALALSDQIYVIDRGHITHQTDIVTARNDLKSIADHLAV